MASTLTQVREGLAARLATISGLRAYSEYPSEAPQPPFAIVVTAQDGDAIEANLTFGGDAIYHLEVLVGVAAADLRSAQKELGPYISVTGTTSIRAAIYAADSLGGVADFCQVGAARDVGGIDYAGGRGFGATLPVDVWSS